MAIKATEEKQSASEPIRLRQKKSLQQFASLDSEDVIMKVAFFAMIVAALFLQGSGGLIPGGLLTVLPGGIGGTIAPNLLLKPLLDAVQNAIDLLPLPVGSSLPCRLADVVPNIYEVFTRAHNYLSNS